MSDKFYSGRLGFCHDDIDNGLTVGRATKSRSPPGATNTLKSFCVDVICVWGAVNFLASDRGRLKFLASDRGVA